MQWKNDTITIKAIKLPVINLTRNLLGLNDENYKILLTGTKDLKIRKTKICLELDQMILMLT